MWKGTEPWDLKSGIGKEGEWNFAGVIRKFPSTVCQSFPSGLYNELGALTRHSFSGLRLQYSDSGEPGCYSFRGA